MKLGKYVTNIGVLSAALGALSTRKETQKMRDDWRRVLVWVTWLIGLATAIASVAMRQQDEEYQAKVKADDAVQKEAKKARKRAVKAS